MKISIFKRLITAYKIIGKNFNTWFSPIITAIVLSILKTAVFTGMFLDRIFFYKINSYQLKKPIIIVGNPRSGTTFLHRYLIRNKIGMGGELWKLLYPSIILQKIVKPFLPILEKISPTRHHSTVAHKTSLQSIETDDAKIKSISSLWKTRMQNICDIGHEKNFSVAIILQPMLATDNRDLIGDEVMFYEKHLDKHGQNAIEIYNIMKSSLNTLDRCTITNDFTDAFDNTKTAVYWDDVHITEQGNEIIAKKMFNLFLPLID